MPDPILPASAITEKLALRPTAAQGRRLESMADAYRRARNWALSEWERRYLDWRTCRCGHRATTAARKFAPACPRCGARHGWFAEARPTRNALSAQLRELRECVRLPDYLRTTADGGVLPALSRNQAVADVEVAYRPGGMPWGAATGGSARRGRIVGRPGPRSTFTIRFSRWRKGRFVSPAGSAR